MQIQIRVAIRYLPTFDIPLSRVSEPASFGAAPAPGIFFFRSRLRLLVKENIILEFLKTDYELSKTRSNTCTSTCRM